MPVSSEISVDRRVRTGSIARAIALGIALGLAALLVVAACLTPSEAGLGTHHQLGLPQCSVRAIFGVRCPSCGMTTSWAHFMRGNLLASASVNTGGLLLALYSLLLVIPTATRVAWTGHTPTERTLRKGAILLIGIVAVTAIDWVVRLAVLGP